MAEIIFNLTDINGAKTVIDEPLKFSLSRDADIPCDALRLYFHSDKALGEIFRISALLDGKAIFSGCCDTQREKRTAQGYNVFIYARSLACLLIDSEAEPATYRSPSADTLFQLNCKGSGFTSSLPRLYCNYNYRVEPGMSRYGALNTFVKCLTNKNVAVSPEGVLYIPDGSGVFTPDINAVCDVKRSINRGSVISRVDYKTDRDGTYCRHLKSRLLEERDCSAARRCNLAVTSRWQRAHTILNMIKSAAADYRTAELTLSGIYMPELYSRVNTEGLSLLDGEEYFVSAVTISFENGGFKSCLRLNGIIDLKEIDYVAE